MPVYAIQFNFTECPIKINNPQNVLNVGRVSGRNLIRGPVGLKNAASKAKTETDHFLLFITHEMLADVLHHTNKKIDSLLAKLPADFNKDFKYLFVKEVSEMELKSIHKTFFIPWIMQTENYGNSDTFF